MRLIVLASIVLVGSLLGCGGDAVDMGGPRDAAVPDSVYELPDAMAPDGSSYDPGNVEPDVAVPDASPAQAALRAAIQSACQPPGTQVQATAVAELKQLLEGRWARCSGRGLSTDDNEDGIELAADGKWYKLAIDENGQWVPASGFNAMGTWIYNENVSTVYFGITLTYTNGGNNYISPEFVTEPLKMRAGWGPAPLGPSDYVSFGALL